jgi:phage terminase large subunit
MRKQKPPEPKKVVRAVEQASGVEPIHFPPKLDFLFKPKRFKVAWGGRDAGRSWGVARALLTIGASRPLRILCAREIQKTLADSVMALLKDQIENLGLSGFYKTGENAISGQNGTEFIFAGLRDLDANKIKSYEGVDIVWVEEAETLSKRSFNILEPTIRKAGSELWFTFNPQLDSDFIYDYFVVNTPEDAAVVKMTWQDNPWFSDVLSNGRERMRLTDRDEYDNIWLGNCRKAVAGAIYAKEIGDLLLKKRFRPIPYDPSMPVHTIWDLGWNDAMSILLVQRMASAVMVIGYLEASYKTYAQCVAELNTLEYVWGTDWLPHDGKQTRPDTGKSPKQILEGLGRKRVEAPQGATDPEEGIKMVRMMFPRLYIDNSDYENDSWEYDGGKRLVECLKRYRRDVSAKTGEPGRPIHDEFSHGCDAVRLLAMIVDKISNEDTPIPRMASYGVLDRTVGI